MAELRYDSVPFRATRTDEGYLLDTPVLTRTGVFNYRQKDGSVRREYRPNDVVFAEDSLKKYKGLPVTLGHPGLVDKNNVKNSIVGTVLSEGRADGTNLVADVVIHDVSPIDQGLKELSVGYTVVLDESSGITPEGEPYDVIQSMIVPNHIAIVKSGRAGNARFNLDAEDSTMDFENVIKELQAEKAELKEQLDKTEARADAAEAVVKSLEEGRAAYEAEAFAKAKARVALEARADAAEVSTEGTDLEIKIRIAEKIAGVRLDGKEELYVDAYLDFHRDRAAQKQEVVAKAKEELKQDAVDPNQLTYAQAQAAYNAKLRGE